MAIKKAPKGSPHPLPVNYVPPGGRPYPVQTDDTWKKLALRAFINPETLVWFNFLTLNPDEVNWYLYRNVGCRKQTKDWLNYEFSTGDKPGIIYFPPSKPIVFKDAIDDWNERMGSGTDLGKALLEADHSDSLYDHIGFSLAVGDFIMTGLAVAAVEMGFLGLGLDVLGPVAALAAVAISLGSPHLDAVNAIKTGKARSGVSQGIVLGAAREEGEFIREHFVAYSSDFNTEYKHERKNFQAAYLAGLVTGVEYGRRLTKRERLLLFKRLEHMLGYSPAGDKYMHRHKMSSVDRKNFYLECAAKFMKDFLK